MRLSAFLQIHVPTEDDDQVCYMPEFLAELTKYMHNVFGAYKVIYFNPAKTKKNLKTPTMTNMIDIYHGSVNLVEKPVFGEGKVHNDYGLGFYCTEHAELAKEWACSSDSDGYANHYQLDMTGLTILNLNTPNYNILNWLAILLENRKFNVADGLPQRAKAYIMENFKVDYKKYDIIVGYRANDSYFSYAGDFVNGTLSLSDLSEAMRLGKLGEQVVLKSKKAFEALKFIGAVKAPREEYFAKYRQRDEEARGRYRQIASKPMAEDETYVIDIIRNNWKNGQSI